MFNKRDLRPYQRRLIRRGFRDNVAFFVDRGLGKTISALTIAMELSATGWDGGALVVAPLRVCEGVWQQEAQEWEHTRGLKIVHVRGSPRQRVTILNSPADVYVMSYDLLKWLGTYIRVAHRRKNATQVKIPPVLILDESTKIKAPGTARFKALRHQLLKRFERVIPMTGTPAPQSLANLWSQIFCVDRGQRLGTSYNLFMQRFFEPEGYGGYRMVPRAGAEAEIHELISDVVVYLDKEDWVSLPKQIIAPVPLALPARTMSLYRRHEREMFTQLDDGGTINSITAATLSMHCHQLANGAIYSDPDNKDTWTTVHDAKLNALRDILEEDDSPIIVAYRFRHDRVRLETAFKNTVVARSDNASTLQSLWNRDKIPILLMNPQSSAHGLNLQKGSGHRVFWFSLTWSLESYLQLLDRLRRSGSRHERLTSIEPYATSTVDEAIRDAIARNDGSQRALFAALKRYQRRRCTK